jgi:GNAT superfamily N-acetyltransferase
MDFTVVRLAPGHDRSTFRSGQADLDRFFARYAGQNQFRHHVGTTWVALTGKGEIAGFVTLAATELPRHDPLPVRRRGPRSPLPALRLARLAVDERFRDQGVGALLLRTTLEVASRMASDVGCVGVVVDAKESAVSFYARFGFHEFHARAGELKDRPRTGPMFLELD